MRKMIRLYVIILVTYRKVFYEIFIYNDLREYKGSLAIIYEKEGGR